MIPSLHSKLIFSRHHPHCMGSQAGQCVEARWGLQQPWWGQHSLGLAAFMSPAPSTGGGGQGHRQAWGNRVPHLLTPPGKGHREGSLSTTSAGITTTSCWEIPFPWQCGDALARMGPLPTSLPAWPLADAHWALSLQSGCDA